MEEVLAIKICHARKITWYYAQYLYAECNIFSLLLVMILIFLPKSFYFLGAYIFLWLTVSEVYAINAINPNKRLL